MPNRLIPLTLAIAAVALAAFAPAGQPDPKRKPNLLTPDIDFAMKELCFPWVKGQGTVEALTDRQGIVENRRGAGFSGGARAWWVGSARLDVLLGETPSGHRSCTVRATAGDPVKLRGALDAVMAGWRLPLTPSVHRFGAGAYASRDVLCAPKDGPQDSLMISTGGPRAPVPLMLTLMTGEARDRRCDAAD